jgi:hypothetical protein
MKGRWQFLAVAVLTLVSQVAVATHIPALEDGPVSNCKDGSSHFCAEVASQEEHLCALCQASIGSITFTLVPQAESILLDEPVLLAEEAGPRSVLKLTSAAPRAPPGLPA